MSEQLRIFTEHLPACRRGPAAAATSAAEALRLVLPFEQRQKARQRARLTAGFEVGIQLPRGTVLRGGDQLRAADGTVLEIVAAREPVSTVWSRDLRRLALVAYHLGNRHVALEIGTGWVRYLADHVLDGDGCAARPDGDPPRRAVRARSRRLRRPRARAWRAVARTRHPHAHDHAARSTRVIFGGVHRHTHDHEQ